MSRFSTFASSYVAAAVIALWSTSMLFAATAVPAVTTASSLVG